VVVLASSGDGLAKYVHGEFGEGTFTFLGGHDPEDPQHAVGDPPTDLSLHPRSPGYRLILNNVLFPAAREEEKRT
ncbi:MAG TPA: asparagine synthetase B, partial [Gemmatimonadota bacterium]|nr:asparagine synthetase B [Gemmatimonadota bacterium]